MTAAFDLLNNSKGKYFVADAGYDSNELIDAVRAKGMRPVICPSSKRVWQRLKLKRKEYRKRYIVEVFFHHLKRFRAIASRYEKTERNFLSLVHLASMIITLATN